MKKNLFSILAVAVLLLTGCQKEDLSIIGDGSEQLARISVNLENAGSATRAIDDFGTGTTANRCILEIYLNAEDRYARLYAPIENFGADFEIRLVTNQQYQLVAWADYVADPNDLTQDYYYITDQDNMGLTSISPSDELDKYDANSDKRDAFFASKPISFSEASSFELTLTRPFGQLNVFTKMTDIDPTISYLNPKSVKVEYSTVLNEDLNALSGSTSDGQPITSFSTQTIETVVDENGLIHLTTDYILAPKEDVGQALIDFKMTFYSDENCTDEITSNNKFVNIPIQRNYRTNVYGELLSEDCYITVDVDPIFNPDENGDEGVSNIVFIDYDIAQQEFQDATFETVIINTKEVGAWGFYNATAKEVILEEGVEILGQSAFSYLHMDGEIIIPASVNSVAQCLFDYADCSSLVFRCASVNGSQGVCQRMGNLKTVTFENNFANLPAYMFAACTSLESVTFNGTNVPTFDATTFQNCNREITVYCPESLVDAYTTAIGTISETTPGSTTITVVGQ